MREIITMKIFLTVWFGQLVSRIGTAMTRFALLIWTYERAVEQGNPATAVALFGFFAFLPLILVSPLAGVWIDRLPRRWIMLAADVAAGVMTIGLLALHMSGHLEIWHLYVAEFLTGVFEAFQAPAYTAASTLLVPKEHYGRAGGLRALAHNGAQVLAPVLGGVALYTIGLAGVMLVDLATIGIAVVTLLLVRFPEARRKDHKPAAAQNSALWREMAFGFQYIWRRPGLAGLTFAFTGMNFIAALTYFSTLPAMILARSGGDQLALATVQGAMGVAGVAGAILMSLWGGPRRRVHGVLLGAAASFLLGDTLLGMGQSLPVWIMGAIFGSFFIPIIGACNDAIWQEQVDPGLQGRVFTAKNMWGQALAPLGYLLAGALADGWLEPAMQPGAPYGSVFGWLVGVGPGAGIGLMMVVAAIAGATLCLGMYLFPAVRNVDTTQEETGAAITFNASAQPA